MSRHRPDAEEAAQLQYETEHTAPGRGKSVVPYMIILIAAAFALLGVAYLMQQRTAESVQGLNQSANSFRTIDQLVDDNRALHEQVAQLQGELSAAQAESKALKDRVDSLENGPAAQEAKNRAEVLIHFTMLEQALRDKDYELAALHTRRLCSGDYDLDLGLASETESFSPAQRLEEVIPILEKQKVLEKGEVTIPQ